MQSSTLRCLYSKLKSTIKLQNNIDIENYKKVLAFLKRKNDSYEPKKSKTFTQENVTTFINNAPDKEYLLMKVALIFALNGTCRCIELCNVMTDNITDTGNIIIVQLKETKTKKNRMFTIGDDCNGYNIYQAYKKLRPVNVLHKRFFFKYSSGKCTSQPIGIQTFGTIPRRIAQFLNLSNCELYTGHCMRRTSATFLAESGADIQVIKRHGGWRSNNTAEGYIEESINDKIRTSKEIFKYANELSISDASKHDITNNTSSNFINSDENKDSTNLTITKDDNVFSKSITMLNVNHCNINIYNVSK